MSRVSFPPCFVLLSLFVTYLETVSSLSLSLSFSRVCVLIDPLSLERRKEERGG